jgi:hypothetical protein
MSGTGLFRPLVAGFDFGSGLVCRRNQMASKFAGCLQVARLALPPEKAAGMLARRKWTHEDDERLQELTAGQLR